MKISIIISTLNAKENILQALNSIFEQTYKNIEVLVSDGASTDGTVNLLEKINEPRLVWWNSENDTGIYDAWNKAIEHITGDWVFFLGADDLFWDAQVLENFAQEVAKIEKCYRIVYGKIVQISQDGDIINYAGEEWSSAKKGFQEGGVMIPHQGVFHRADLFSNGHRFDSTFKISGDYDFLLKVLKKEPPLFISSLIVTRMRCGGVSGKFNDFSLLNESMYARKKNGYPETLSTLMLRFRYMARGITVYFFGEAFAIKLNKFICNLLIK